MHPARLLRHPTALAWTLAAAFAAAYTCVAVNRHRRGLTQAYDLGIFEQAVRAYAQGNAPVVPLKGPGFHLLGDHFHPLLAVLAPAYRVFPTPVTLLVAQALLLALAIVPLTRWAYEVGGPRTALVVGCGVGASWGIVNAAADDFHEIAFAVPLLAFAATALGRGHHRAAALWALPLLLVKEDLGLTVAAVGALLAHRARRAGRSPGAGVALAAGGVLATLLTVLVLLPAFNPQGSFDYWHQLSDAGRDRPLWSAALHLGWPPVKWLLLFLLAATAGFLGLRSPLVLLCLPTLGWRLVSTNSHYWGVSYHYSAVLMPLLFAALVDALRRAGPLRARRALAVSALVAVITLPLYPLHEVVMPEAWRTSPRLVATRSMLDRIPDDARVAASNRLAAQLTARTTVTLVCRDDGPAPDWVAVDLTDPSVKAPCAITDTVRMLATYEERGYRRLVERDGLVLLRRD